ncbi:MAG: transcriptional repressor [Candidatus Omnitrophica bacterium]|nr:transcriptional repressor [Candidatus Omnitrophota bacterium]
MRNLRDKKTFWCYEKLSKCCCRLTKPRHAILDVLSATEKHLNAEQIYKSASRIEPNIGLATIYRNLELLVNIGLVWKFETGNSKTVYELAECRHESHHHHLICKKCNSIIDYSGFRDNEKDFIRRREEMLSKKYDFKIQNHCIDFYGLCAKCRNA